MTVGERLVQLREDAGFKTRKEFAQKIGIPETTLRNYEKNDREPGHTFLKQMSEYFNVSVDYILGLTDEKEVLHQTRLKSSEQELIDKYRYLDEHGKEMVDIVIDKEYDRCQNEDEIIITLTPQEIRALPLDQRMKIEQHVDDDGVLRVARVSGSRRRKDGGQ